jgi:hypothetical protein
MAVEADRLGLWAVLLGDADRSTVEAAALATETVDIHLAVWLDGTDHHPVGLAEEVAVLDHLSQRRALAVVDGPDEVVDTVDRLLAGHLVAGVALTPPPAQTRVPVWRAADLGAIGLTGDLDRDRETIDRLRDGGRAQVFVTWPGPLAVLARHLATRAAEPAFPQIVADLADGIDPPPVDRGGR